MEGSQPDQIVLDDGFTITAFTEVAGFIQCICGDAVHWLRGTCASTGRAIVSDIIEDDDYHLTLHWEGVPQRMPVFQIMELADLAFERRSDERDMISGLAALL